LPTGEKVTARVVAATKQEMVRIDGHVVSTAGPGGRPRPEGHVLRLPSSTLEAPMGADVFRSAAVPGPEREVRVRFDGSDFELTLDGQVIPPEPEPPSPPPKEAKPRPTRTPRSILLRLRAAPRWCLPFIAACVVMPIASLGGLVPSLVGVASAGGVLVVTERLRERRLVAIGASSGLVAGCWGFFFLVVLGLGTGLVSRGVAACQLDPSVVYVWTKRGVFDPRKPASRCVDERASHVSGMRGSLAIRPSDGALVFVHDGQLARAVAGNRLVPSCDSAIRLPSTFATPSCGCGRADEGSVVATLTVPDSESVVYTCHYSHLVPAEEIDLVSAGGSSTARRWHRTDGDLVVPGVQDIITIGYDGAVLAEMATGFAVYRGGVAYPLGGEWPKGANWIERVARATADGFLLVGTEMLTAEPALKGRYRRRLWKVDRDGHVVLKGTYAATVDNVMNAVLDPSGNLVQVGPTGVIAFAPDQSPARVILDPETALGLGISLAEARVVTGP
jgi:hypothetical protein